jgi:hypothetical protein
VGHHSITASYDGNTSYARSPSSNVVDQVVNKAPTTSAVTSSLNPSTFGQSVTFTARANSSTGMPTGTFAFFADGVGITGCAAVTVSAVEATCATSTLAVGNRAITATYSGDGSFTGSTGTLAGGQTVTKAPTSTALTAAPSPATFGQAVTFTATVNPTSPNATAPTGTVSFFLNGQATPVATLPLSGNQAAFTTAGLGAGPQSMVAVYNGDANFLTSTSPAANVTVAAGRTITGSYAGTLVVPSGSSVLLKNATVSGGIIVQGGGAIDIENSTIAGAVSASGPSALRMCASTTGGAVTVSNATGFVLIGDPGDDGCAVNTIGGGLTLQNNHGGVEAENNHVKGAVTVSGNSGTGAFPEDSAPEITGNGP